MGWFTLCAGYAGIARDTVSDRRGRGNAQCDYAGVA